MSDEAPASEPMPNPSIAFLQAEIDEVSGRVSTPATALPTIAIQVCARAAEAAEGAASAAIEGEITDAEAARVLARIGAAGRALGALERAVRGTRRVSR